MQHFLLALSFLTILPSRTEAPRPGDIGRAAVWFPLIGLFIGGILAGAYYGLSLIFQPPLAAAMIVALWAAITGGLHLDGLADCCDGLFATTTPERRLEIMRDPRLGSFGVIGLILFLILKVLAITMLDSTATTTLVLLLAPAFGRWLILFVALQPTARPGGLGADFGLGLKPHTFALAAAVPLMLTLVFFSPRALAAVAAAHLVTFGVILIARSRLGGVTGDVFGLTVELAELAVLLTFAAN